MALLAQPVPPARGRREPEQRASARRDSTGKPGARAQREKSAPGSPPRHRCQRQEHRDDTEQMQLLQRCARAGPPEPPSIRPSGCAAPGAALRHARPNTADHRQRPRPDRRSKTDQVARRRQVACGIPSRSGPDSAIRAPPRARGRAAAQTGPAGLHRDQRAVVQLPLAPVPVWSPRRAAGGTAASRPAPCRPSAIPERFHAGKFAAGRRRGQCSVLHQTQEEPRHPPPTPTSPALRCTWTRPASASGDRRPVSGTPSAPVTGV